MHPLLPDLTKLSDAELADKIGELNKKIAIASRMSNGAVVQQLYMILESFQYEYRMRNEKQLEEIMKQNKIQMKDILDI